MWSIIRKHFGRLVSWSESPPLCCGSQSSISCNQFSIGSTIKLKQKGCKKEKADILQHFSPLRKLGSHNSNKATTLWLETICVQHPLNMCEDQRFCCSCSSWQQRKPGRGGKHIQNEHTRCMKSSLTLAGAHPPIYYTLQYASDSYSSSQFIDLPWQISKVCQNGQGGESSVGPFPSKNHLPFT